MMKPHKEIINLMDNTENLIVEINSIIKHTNRFKLTREVVEKIQELRSLLEKDLVYYNFIIKTNNTFELEEMIEHKTYYLNNIKNDINMFKRILQ